METKVCSKCKIEKPLTEFNKDKRGTNGVRSDCKKCRSKVKPKELHKPNRAKHKFCGKCGISFEPRSNRQVWCDECASVEKPRIKKEGLREYHKRTYKRKGYSHLVGENANAFKSGIGIYYKLLNHITECERCGSKENLLVHHKDRNRKNNDLDNLEKLCKGCHQEEHMRRDSLGRYSYSE
jgi:hypothetical protein